MGAGLDLASADNITATDNIAMDTLFAGAHHLRL